MIRNKVLELKKLGKMPNEHLDDEDSIEDLINQYDELLESIEKPISYDEGEVLIELFPENAFYDLHWTLLQLIESLFGKIELSKYEKLIAKCPSAEWNEALHDRLMKWKKKQK
ncbi:MAG: hypothetical protein MJA31_14350 [Clostridia bacterium]|nr:hypothetical protein [Clostridia bacterium]